MKLFIFGLFSFLVCCDQAENNHHDADTTNSDASDADSERERHPEELCGPLPSIYPPTSPRPSVDSGACHAVCQGDLACHLECSDATSYVDCFLNTLTICSWPACRISYAALDCCMMDSCGISALETTSNSDCVLENCSQEYSDFVRCGEAQNCYDVAHVTCFETPPEIPQEERYCSENEQVGADRWIGERITTRSDIGEACYEDICYEWPGNCVDQESDYHECWQVELDYCSYYTVCTEVFEELLCCGVTHCRHIPAKQEEQYKACVNKNCRRLGILFSDCETGLFVCCYYAQEYCLRPD